MPSCCVKQCGARKNNNNPTLSLHRFPKNDVLKNKWLAVIGTKNINRRNKILFVCSSHFEEKCFNKTLDIIRLHEGAIPSSHLLPTCACRLDSCTLSDMNTEESNCSTEIKFPDDPNINADLKERITKEKRNRHLFNYGREDLNKAIEAIKNKSMGIREACRVYGVPKTTVHDRLSGKISINKMPKVGPDPVLGHDGEEKVKNWVLDMARCGFPIQKKDLLESVSKIIKDSGRKNPFKDGVPGETWYKGFLKRHPQISVREPEGINNARAAVTERRIRCWFTDLKEYLKSINCLDIFDDPNRIFNGDETGFALCPKSGKVLGPKGYKNLYTIKKSNDKENLTVLVVFAASGKICPPLVVFPYIRPPKILVDSMPDSWVLGRSESGWMRSDIFFEYVCNSFNTWLGQQGIKKPIILFIDGHKSHMTVPLSNFCEKNGIVLYALPANTTHILQPADVSVFKPLKQEWKKTVISWQGREQNLNKTITKLNFCTVLKETFSNINLESAIINGFRKCGLYPLDDDAVDYTKCVKDTIQSKRVSNSNKTKLYAKDYDTALKVISLLRENLCKQNIDTDIILTEIKKAKSTRRSKSKTPRNSTASTNISRNSAVSTLSRNSVASNMSHSLLRVDTAEYEYAVTPENNHCRPPASNIAPTLDLLTAQVSTDATLQQFLQENIENIEIPEVGSFISLDNISVLPLGDTAVSQISSPPDPNLTRPKHDCRPHSTVLAEIQINSFDEVFSRHLQFPETPPAAKERNKGPNLPSAISSTAWRQYYEDKEKLKENQAIEKKRKLQLRAEEKERKLKEKARKLLKKKAAQKCSLKKRANIQCSKCSEDLISDVEDDSDKNIGCDKCERWYHLKCTILKDLAYIEAAASDYTCLFC